MIIGKKRNRKVDFLAPFLALVLPAVYSLGQGGGRDLAPPRPGGAVAQPGLPAAAVRPRATVAADHEGEVPALKFDNAPIEILLQAYAQETGRTLLRSPGLPSANVTLRSQQPMSLDEYLMAIETVLSLHGVALLPVDESFIKVVPVKDARRLGIRTELASPEDPHREAGQLVSQMVELQHVAINEIRPTLDGIRRSEGQIQVFERTNSILITDTADNVNRMLEIIKYIDQPVVQREEANVRRVRFAKASEIKRSLEEIIADARREQTRDRDVPAARRAGAPGIETRRAETPPDVPGVIRPRRPERTPTPREEETSAVIESLVEEAERGIIRGRVHIVADDRTNILIIITRPENMTFFDRIIDVLDVETAPDVIVEVIRLEHAVAEEVARMLNELIGERADAGRRPGGETEPSDEDARDEDRSARLAEFADRLRREAGGEPMTAEARSKVGELRRENIKILANERTNALIIMASQSDLATLMEIISDMDIMLSQVLIETVILEVNLEERLETGVDWVQRAMVAYDGGQARAAFATRGGGGTMRPLDPLTRTTAQSFGGEASGLSHYLTIFGLNMDLVLKATSSDSRARILSSPVILTQDNKQATIEATTRQYFLKGTRYIATGTGQYETVDDVEQRDIGITLQVTPRINARGFVVMNVEQTIENVIGTQRINEGDWPIVSSRRVGADIAVSSGETVVLGGLVLNNQRSVRGGVPVLSRIPLLGSLFRSSRVEDSRSEVVVFLTPYVLDSPSELTAEARRRKDAISAGDMWRAGWSDSKLADRPDEPPDTLTGPEEDDGGAHREPDPGATNGVPRSATPGEAGKSELEAAVRGVFAP